MTKAQQFEAKHINLGMTTYQISELLEKESIKITNVGPYCYKFIFDDYSAIVLEDDVQWYSVTTSDGPMFSNRRSLIPEYRFEMVTV